jgi:Fe2+ or Zn2+ uptake regulation protein
MLNRASLTQLLRARGIRPSSQRLAVAAAVMGRDDHPSADQVWERARAVLPEVSRATVYNTLNRLVDEGLLRPVELAGGCVVFDCNIADHHHFIDEATGHIYDIPWDALQVGNLDILEGYEVREYQVVLRGRRRSTRTSVSKRA